LSEPRIDSHQHFWSLERGDYDWLTPGLTPLYRDFGPEDLAPHLEATGIEHTILVQAAPTVAETGFLLSIAERTDFVAGVVGWVDLSASDAPDTIADLASNGYLRGVRPMIQDIPDVDWVLSADLEPGLHALIDTGLTFDALVNPAHLPNLRALLSRHPDLEVVIDHGAKPSIARAEFEPWARDLAEIARDSSAACKLSGLVTEAGPNCSFDTLRPYLDHLFEYFGPERLMWGSDWPVVNLAGGYGAWWKMTERTLEPLDAKARAAVLGGTAARFYGIDLGMHRRSQ
jgi:L-fuconolactonase